MDEFTQCDTTISVYPCKIFVRVFDVTYPSLEIGHVNSSVTSKVETQQIVLQLGNDWFSII